MLEHFQWDDESPARAELASELADVSLYLLQLASVTQIDLEQAILDKLKVNYGREWSATRLAPPSPDGVLPSGERGEAA